MDSEVIDGIAVDIPSGTGGVADTILFGASPESPDLMKPLRIWVGGDGGDRLRLHRRSGYDEASGQHQGRHQKTSAMSKEEFHGAIKERRASAEDLVQLYDGISSRTRSNSRSGDGRRGDDPIMIIENREQVCSGWSIGTMPDGRSH